MTVRSRFHLAVIGFLVAGAAGAHLSQRAVDRARSEPDLATRARYLPSSRAVAVASMGYELPLAHLMWVRTVLTFVDIIDGKLSNGGPWLRAILDSTTTLDPYWRTAYFYGGGMLRVLGDIDGSDEVYADGMAWLPSDPFFPFSIGMNAYLYRSDNERAFRYLDRASRMEGAPAWYRAAAAGFLDEKGHRLAAIRYLEEEMANERRPEVLRAIRPKYLTLVHDELAERIEEARASWERREGRPLTDLASLGDLPADPFEEGWFIAPDGRVRSTARDRIVAREARSREREMLLRPP